MYMSVCSYLQKKSFKTTQHNLPSRQPYHSAAQDWFTTEAKKVEPGQYLDGRPGKTRLLLEEVLVRPSGVLTLQSVWVLTPQYNDGDTIL